MSSGGKYGTRHRAVDMHAFIGSRCASMALIYVRACVRVRQSRRQAAVGLGVVEEVCINHPIAIRLNEKPMERRKGECSSQGRMRV